ncbi:cytochrome c oxidase assembly protein [Methylocystis sp. FS]|uniref:cytochrome c oxidase assembly protein n=1 Tax=Methylocystis silviterrae TaxID=2743612 RepID=UPI001582BE45|nr:cytochrome c oxidase assembly protein [Methylocystis silviterrae]NUJ79023.1 cytochrome c oxidase assembly protein [Methylocystis silviterrae]
MSRTKLAIASTADGARPAQAAWDSRSKIVVAGIVVCAVGLAASAGPGLGPRASHMATHILLMSALAPFLAVLWMHFTSAPVLATGRALAIVTVAQLALLYAWHAPGASAYVERHPTAHLLMHASLLAAALLFWLAILGDTGVARWRGVAALAITGKLACLLGVLLVFAPRVLDTSAASWGATTETMLADQRLAGLLMLAACPASYVLTGVSIASRWLLDMEDNRSRARTYRPDGA